MEINSVIVDDVSHLEHVERQAWHAYTQRRGPHPRRLHMIRRMNRIMDNWITINLRQRRIRWEDLSRLHQLEWKRQASNYWHTYGHTMT